MEGNIFCTVLNDILHINFFINANRKIFTFQKMVFYLPFAFFFFLKYHS